MLFNRLWGLIVLTIGAAVIGFWFPQVPAIATGYCLLVALVWRRQSAAVEAIEGRDEVEFWFDAPRRSASRSCCGCPACTRSSRCRSWPPRLRSLRSSSQGRVLPTSAAVTRAPRRGDAVADVRQRLDAVRVGVDEQRRHSAAARVGVVQVAPVGIGVDLEEGAGLDRLRDHPVGVERVGLAALEQPSVGCPITSTSGCSIARSMRSVCFFSESRNDVCRLA